MSRERGLHKTSILGPWGLKEVADIGVLGMGTGGPEALS